MMIIDNMLPQRERKEVYDFLISRLASSVSTPL